MSLQFFHSNVRSIKQKEWLYSCNNLVFFVFNAPKIDIDSHKLLFEDIRVKDRLKQIELMGIPLIIMARKNLSTLMELTEIDP